MKPLVYSLSCLNIAGEALTTSARLSHSSPWLCNFYYNPSRSLFHSSVCLPLSTDLWGNSTSGQDEITWIEFTFLSETTKKWVKHMEKWFSRHYQATKTVTSQRWESEVSPKIGPAHFLEFPSKARGWEARQGPADYWVGNPRRSRQLSFKGNKRASHRENSGDVQSSPPEFSWVLLTSVRKLEAGERPSRK